MKLGKMKVRITFTEPLLGSSPSDKEIYTNFIASKAPNASTMEEEVANFGSDEVVRKETTIFPRMEDGSLMYYDYQIKGYLKEACGMLARLKDEKTESSKIKAYKKVINGLIFVFPRRIPILLPDGGEITINQRPLRAETQQGERTALASSEQIPAGTKMEFEIRTLTDAYNDAIIEWLEYGALKGMGQWRNASWGRFEYEILD